MMLFRSQPHGFLSSNDQLALDLQFAADKSYGVDLNNPPGFLINSRVGPPASFSRASGATEINSSGIVTYARENLAWWSESLTTSTTWTTSNVNVIIDGVGPNNETAFEISETAATSQHWILNRGGSVVNSTPIQVSTNYTSSVFLKKVSGSVDWVQLTLGTNAFSSSCYLNVNLSNGTFGSSSGLASGTSPVITSFTNGWYRVSFTVTSLSNAAATSNNLIIAFTNNVNTATRLPSYAGNVTNKILATAAQFERGNVVRDYIFTTSSARYAPRFDHNSVTQTSRGLLIESVSRTNLALYSGVINKDRGWAGNGIVTPSGVGPDGNTSYQLSEANITNIQTVANVGGTGTTSATSVTIGTVYTGSFFVKKVAGSVDWIQLTFGGVGFGEAQYANFNISTGTVGNFAGLASGTTPQIETYANGWYRISISVVASTTTTVTNNAILVFIQNTNGTTRIPNYAGNSSNRVLATMWQFEVGAHASSYIPTTSTSVIRSADVCNITGSSFDGFYNNNEGTFIVDAAALGFSTSNAGIVRVPGVYSLYNRVAQGNRLTVALGSQALTVPSNYNALRTYYKSAVSANLNGADFVINGSQIADSFTEMSLTPTSSLLTFNDIPTAICNNWIRSFRYYRRTLPVPKLQALTSRNEINEYIDAIKSTGVVVSSSQQTAIETFITSGKVNGWWYKMKRIYLPIWGNENANSIDMMELTRGRFVGNVIHSFGSVDTSSPTGYFLADSTPASLGLTSNDACIFSAIYNGSQDFMGCAGTSNSRLLVGRVATTRRAVIPSTATQVGSGSDSLGILISSRIGNVTSLYQRKTSGWVTPENITNIDNTALPAFAPAFLGNFNSSGVVTTGRTNAGKFICYGYGLGLDSSLSELFSLDIKTLWEACTELTLP